jgi:hypothetical protein
MGDILNRLMDFPKQDLGNYRIFLYLLVMVVVTVDMEVMFYGHHALHSRHAAIAAVFPALQHFLILF